MRARGKEMQRSLEKRGFTVVLTGGGHFRITHPGMDGPVFTGTSPSDVRSVKNLEAMLRRKMKGTKE